MSDNRGQANDPIKKPPLPEPGQSLRKQIDELIFDHVVWWGLWIGVLFAMTAVEWVRWYFDLPYAPLIFTALTLVSVPLAIWRLRQLKGRLQNLVLGLKGERWLGQFLQNRLLRKGYWVVHDIQDDNFNIDHALIGPTGVYAIETKTRSKRSGDARVKYDGERLLVDGWEPDRDPIGQARACARRLQEILREYAGLAVSVRSVVIFPNWFVDGPKGPVETWVLNEKAFVKFLDNETVRLDASEVHQLAAALGRYVRDTENRHDA